MLQIDGITKFYGNSRAVSEASFRVARGELVCLLGPSGCGKSTLLRIISGLTRADSGRIAIEGRDVTTLPANQRPTAMVFQSHALWNHMSVAQNVAFGLRVKGLPAREISEKVAAGLELVGLSGFEKRRPAELSGGQAQRVALARCLVVEPKILLMDEPFSALDAHLRKNLRAELKQLQHRLELTTIFVTHDQEEAMELADRIVVMNAGVIEQIGRPGDLYLEPQTLSVARFIGSMNEVETIVEAGVARWNGAALPVALPDGPVTMLCRPEDLHEEGTGALFSVVRVIDLGSSIRVGLATRDGRPMDWLCPRPMAPQAGSKVSLMPDRLLFYRGGALLGSIRPGQSIPAPQFLKARA